MARTRQEAWRLNTVQRVVVGSVQDSGTEVEHLCVQRRGRRRRRTGDRREVYLGKHEILLNVEFDRKFEEIAG